MDRYDDDNYYTGYCEHGQYVGGCGVDWMCTWCESGVSLAEAQRIVRNERTAAVRERAAQAERVLALLLSRHGADVGGSFCADMATRSSYIMNPLSRYGRH